ncbi:MAG: hypothetical protein JXR03_20770 [Cyclobacteriaceae bacterium]
MKSILTKTSVILVVLVSTGLTLLAQSPGAPPATPIDGGLSLLLAAGGIYGLKKLRENKG